MKGKKIFIGGLIAFLLSCTPSTVAMKPVEEHKNLLFEVCARGDINLVDHLIKNGININTRDYYGWTPLHIACLLGDKDLVIYLIEHGADPYAFNAQNLSAAQIALSKGHTEIADYIIASLEPNRQKFDQIKRLENINTAEVHQKIAAAERNYGILTELPNPITVENHAVVNTAQVPLHTTPQTIQSKVQQSKATVPSIKPKKQLEQSMKAPKKKSKKKSAKKKNTPTIQHAVTPQPEQTIGQELSNGIQITRTDSAISIMEPAAKPDCYTEIILFKDCQNCIPDGIYYLVADGLILVEGTLVNSAGVKIYNPLLNLTYTNHVLGKMYNIKDKRHAFSTLVETEGARWARIVIKNPVNQPQALLGSKNFEISITIPGQIDEIDYSTGKKVIKKSMTGIFEFVVRKNLYKPHGTCMHRFFAPTSKSVVGATEFGASDKGH